MVAWQLPLNQTEATASKCVKETLRHQGPEPVMSGQSGVLSESVSTEVTVDGEPAASAVEAVSLDGGRGGRRRSTGDTTNETQLAAAALPLQVTGNAGYVIRTSGVVGGWRA